MKNRSYIGEGFPLPGAGTAERLESQKSKAVGSRPSLNTASHPPLRLLVVDDNYDMALLFKEMLSLNGHQVEMAQDGPTALELADQLRPHVIFLDIGLPRMSGFEVARRLREGGHGAALLVALSGYDRDHHRAEPAISLLDRYFRKPVDFDQVDELLASVSR